LQFGAFINCNFDQQFLQKLASALIMALHDKHLVGNKISKILLINFMVNSQNLFDRQLLRQNYKRYQRVFAELGLDVVVRLNHRGLLAGIAEVAGLGDRLTDFTVALDKLDKIGADGVRLDWRERGFTEQQSAALEPALEPMTDMAATLSRMERWLSSSEQGMAALADLRWLTERVASFGPLALDVTLARGLNYYTGCIFEVQARDVAMGSVGGGGEGSGGGGGGGGAGGAGNGGKGNGGSSGRSTGGAAISDSIREGIALA
jgi:hypothetical protein